MRSKLYTSARWVREYPPPGARLFGPGYGGSIRLGPMLPGLGRLLRGLVVHIGHLLPSPVDDDAPIGAALDDLVVGDIDGDGESPGRASGRTPRRTPCGWRRDRGGRGSRGVWYE